MPLVRPGPRLAHGSAPSPELSGLVLKAAGIVPGGEEGGDAGPYPPGTERVENAMGIFGIGVAIVLLACAVLIVVRGRKR
jgi:hypothetical protein